MITKVKNVAASNAGVVLRQLGRLLIKPGELLDLTTREGWRSFKSQRELRELIERKLLEDISG